MSDESKTAEGDYVHMDGGKGHTPGGLKSSLSLDDPNLSQEDRDLRLAIAMQQEENEAAIASARKKSASIKASNDHRSARSGAHGKLAAIRGKDMGMLSVPKEYTTADAYTKGEYAPPGSANMSSILPGERADFALASELQKVEDTASSAAIAARKLAHLTVEERTAKGHRSGVSSMRR